ncbi:hypothetical protein NKI34_34455 [Mesorhizobium sp. M0700]|uniref:hypothetical protein n=1 Tax=unclassified Mesorhizobium TaxID=325217 RepID=UPI003337FFCC
MENHVDRRVILCPEAEYKNLYEWSVQEVGANGNKIDRDQIPWEWTLYFKATELTLHDTLTVGSLMSGAPHDEINTVIAKQSISAKLHPFGAARPPSYSMFGTDRTITDISLSIIPSAVNDEQEQCVAWGVVSYTSEIDFREETTPDCIGFYLFVRPDRFARYAEMVASSALEEVLFFVGRVPGFYSDWSPSTSTNRIKILADKNAQKIEIPPDCEIDPPRLGPAQHSPCGRSFEGDTENAGGDGRRNTRQGQRRRAGRRWPRRGCGRRRSGLIGMQVRKTWLTRLFRLNPITDRQPRTLKRSASCPPYGLQRGSLPASCYCY